MSGMIDLLAALLILLTIVKLIVLSVNAPAWLNMAKALYARPALAGSAAYVLAGLVLAVLLESGLTIVQILAVCLFASLLFIPGLAPYMGDVLRQVEGKTFREILRDQWFSTLVWLGLLSWGACALLFR
jgi:hypothetical protein